MEQHEEADEFLDYLSAENNLPSACLNGKKAHMESVESEKSLHHPLVASVEPEELETQEKEVITSIVATVQRNAPLVLSPMEGFERQNLSIADKLRKTLPGDESHPMDHPAASNEPNTERAEHATCLPSSSATSTDFPREGPLYENMDSAGSLHELYRPSGSEGITSEVDFQPIMDINSVSETSNVNIYWDHFSKVPISEAFSTTLYNSFRLNPSSIGGANAKTFRLSASEGGATILTSRVESDEKNDSHAYHEGETNANWGFADWELEDGMIGLPLEGDLDYLSEEREEGDKVRGYDLFSWPMSLLTETIDFQMKIIMFGVSIAMWLFNLFVMEPINWIFWARDTIVTGISDLFGLISCIFRFLGHLQEQLVLSFKRAAKRLAIGVFTATYVTIAVSLLLVPAFLLGFLFVGSFVESPNQIQEQIYFDYTQQSPSASISLFPVHVTQKLRASAIVHPEKVVNKRLIPLDHKISVTVSLKMPESEHNLHIGMFQVSAELISLKGQLIARFAHPCMLHFHSWPIRYVKTVILAVPLMLGLYSESQVVVIHLVDSYEDFMNPTANIKILLESRAGYLPGAGLPEVYCADAVIQSQLPRAKSIAYQWKWTFFVWTGLGMFLFEVALLLCCCRQFFIPFVSAHDRTKVRYRGGEETQKSPSAFETELVNVGQSERDRRAAFQEDMVATNVSESGPHIHDVDNFFGEEREALSRKENLEMLRRVTRFWE